MGRFIPKSTNADYAGSPVAAWFLTLAAVGTIVPSLIHTFVDDGGAGRIAGLDLTHNRQLIIGLFAWAGATQLVWGTLMLLVSLYYRSFVPLYIALILVERSIIGLNTWVLKPGEGTHHPPEAYVTLVAIPLLMIMLDLAVPKAGGKTGSAQDLSKTK